MKTALQIMVAVLFAPIFLMNCGGTAAKAKQPQAVATVDTITDEGYIQNMYYMVYQGAAAYGVTLDNGKEYSFSTDNLGGDNHNELRLFINPETKDILNLNAEGAKRINTGYLGKQVKLVIDEKTSVIKSLKLTGNEKAIPVSSVVYNGYVKELTSDKYGYKYLGFTTEQGEEKKIRMDLDADNHYTVSTIYNGMNKRGDCVFETKNYSLALISGNEQKNATVEAEYKLIESKDVDPSDNASYTRFFYDYVVKDVTWGKGAIDLPAEQQD